MSNNKKTPERSEVTGIKNKWSEFEKTFRQCIYREKNVLFSK